MLTIEDVRLVACSVPRTTEDLVQGRACFRVGVLLITEAWPMMCRGRAREHFQA